MTDTSFFNQALNIIKFLNIKHKVPNIKHKLFQAKKKKRLDIGISAAESSINQA